MLEIYPLVFTPSDQSTPLRAQPRFALLHAPPTEFGWGGRAEGDGTQSGHAAGEALPALAGAGRKSLWKFSLQDSDALWLSARSWRGILLLE